MKRLLEEARGRIETESRDAKIEKKTERRCRDAIEVAFQAIMSGWKMVGRETGKSW